VKSKVVVVTGAAGGIGAALADSFLRRETRVALLDRDAAGARAVAVRIDPTGANTIAIECDVTSFDQCRAATETITSRWGGIDVLVNNAGLTQLGRFQDTQVDVLHRVMEVNFFGAVHCTKAALPTLLERRGRIVVISSVAGFAPLALRTGYSASKHALHGFFGSLRAEHSRDGLHVLLVCPSFVATAIGDHALGVDDASAPPQARTGVRAPADPRDVAEAVVRAVQTRKKFLLVQREAKLSYLVSRLAPWLYERLMIRRTLPPTE